MSGPYPTVQAYLERLPRGLDSYPECQVKASVIRDALKSRPLDDDTALPSEIRSLLAEPPPVSSFISEALFNATMLAIHDAHFASLGGEAFIDWVHGRNRKLLRTPLYRILFAVLSPERLLVGMSHRWQAFRKGTELELLERSKSTAVLRLGFPPHLYPQLTVVSMGAAVRAAIECAGASSVDMSFDEITNHSAVFRIHWQ